MVKNRLASGLLTEFVAADLGVGIGDISDGE